MDKEDSIAAKIAFDFQEITLQNLLKRSGDFAIHSGIESDWEINISFPVSLTGDGVNRFLPILDKKVYLLNNNENGKKEIHAYLLGWNKEEIAVASKLFNMIAGNCNEYTNKKYVK